MNAEGARQGGSVHKAGVLGGPEGILRIGTIAPGKLDEPTASHGSTPADRDRTGLTSDMT